MAAIPTAASATAATPTAAGVAAASAALVGWITTGALVDAIEVLDSLGNTPMPALVAAKVCNIIHWARSVHVGYTAERNEIIGRYGTSVGDGKYNIPAEKVNLFNAAIRNLQGEQTAPLPSEYALTLAELVDIKLTPGQYSRMQMFIK
jgi:hypothetical protein